MVKKMQYDDSLSTIRRLPDKMKDVNLEFRVYSNVTHKRTKSF